MNIIKGVIDKITVRDSLSLVGIKVKDIHLTAIVIDTPETDSHLLIGKAINAIFKETEVIIGKGNNHSISLQNKIEGRIISIESGDLLSRLRLDTVAGEIISVITTNAVNQLKLEENSQVMAMIKTNEIMLQYD